MFVYVDTSAVFKLLVAEDGTEMARVVWEQANRLLASRLLWVETACALTKAVREERLKRGEATHLFGEFSYLADQVDLITPSQHVIATAAVVAFETNLRSYDATHLASALIAGVDAMLSAGDDLLEAAAAHGLAVADCRTDR